MSEKKRETDLEQIRRARTVLRHIDRIGPALRWWLRERLNAEECSNATIVQMRRAGLR